jgi:hypothetical protein
MPYQNWEDVGDIVERLRICKVKDVVDNLQDLRYIITKRHIGQQSVDLVKPNVYSCEKYTRLPDNEHFVFDGDGRWSFYLDKLLISVRAIYYTVSKSKHFDNKKLQELEEESLEYIHKILNLMYNIDEVFTRSAIEKKYSLKWADDNEGEIIHKVKAKRKSSTKFRKNVISCNDGDALRKLLQQEVEECMQSDYE